MSKTDPEQSSIDLEKIDPWKESFNQNELALFQERLEERFGIDFEQLDYELKGASELELKPFYTGINETFEIYGTAVNLCFEESNTGYEVEYWSDDLEVLGEFSDWMKPEEEEDNVEVMDEPYKVRDVKDIQLKTIIENLEEKTVLTDPVPRPGKGQVRRYPVRMENLNLGEEESYNDKAFKVVGDGTYRVEGVAEQEPGLGYELEGEIHIRPVKTEDGIYNIGINAELTSLGYLVDQVRKIDTGYEDFGEDVLEP